jgi:HlyD family secretion protein
MSTRRSSYRARRVRMRRARIRFLVFLLLASVFVYGAVRFILSRILTRVEVAKFGRLEQSMMVQGVVMRNETLVLSPIPGSLQRFCEDNELVKAGTLVVEVANPDIRQQLEPMIQAVSAEIKRNESQRNAAIQVIANELSGLNVQILSAKSRNDTKLLAELEREKQELENQFETAEAEFEDKITVLGERLDRLNELGKVGVYSYTAREGCLVSFSFDGYEYFLSPSNLEHITAQDFKAVADGWFTVNDGMGINIGQPIARIINRSKMCVAFVVSDERFSVFEEGKPVSLRFGNQAARTYGAKVIRVRGDAFSDDALVVCELDNYVDEFTNVRITPMEVIFQGYAGIILPETAVVKERGKDHVYVVSEGAHVAVPVTVKGRIDGYVAVEGVMEGAKVITNP